MFHRSSRSRWVAAESIGQVEALLGSAESAFTETQGRPFGEGIAEDEHLAVGLIPEVRFTSLPQLPSSAAAAVLSLFS
jgi:hypothetical protein